MERREDGPVFLGLFGSARNETKLASATYH